jgi:hypothetical protein
MATSFRNTAAFGKRMEYYIIGLMLKEGLDVYIPMVDDDAIDAVVKKPDGSYVEIQIKTTSNNVKFGDTGLFAALKHNYRPNYWFVFYSERLETIWIMSSKEFVAKSNQGPKAKLKGERTIRLSGRNTKAKTEHVLPRFEKFVATNFDRIRLENPNK